MSYSIITKKINISKNLLFPLVEVTKTKKEALFQPEKCFLYMEDFCSIDELEMGAFYRWVEGFELFEKDKILPKCIRAKKVESGNIYIFDLLNYADDVYEFLQGNYSKFLPNTKAKIQYYHGDTGINKAVMPLKGHDFKIILYPEYYFEEASKEIGVPIEYLKQVGELLSKPNKEEETWKE